MTKPDSKLDEILRLVDGLAPEEQLALYERLRDRLCACRRAALEADVCAGREEFERCGCTEVSADDLMAELLTCDGGS